jgi:hypothetical protein
MKTMIRKLHLYFFQGLPVVGMLIALGIWFDPIMGYYGRPDHLQDGKHFSVRHTFNVQIPLIITKEYPDK